MSLLYKRVGLISNSSLKPEDKKALQTMGGTIDWVRDEAGCTVSYLDITATAGKILLLSSDQNLLREKGANAKTITQSHYTVDIVGRKLAEYLYKELKNFR